MVQLLETPADGRYIENVLNGEANYGVALSEVLQARLKGQPVVVLAAIFQHSPAALFARTDAGIKYLHDIVGKRLTLGHMRRNPDVLGMFQREGISHDQLTNNIIPLSSYLSNFVSNKSDVVPGYITTLPYYLKNRDLPFIMFRPSDYGIDFYGDCIITSERELKDHPERTAKFLAASLRGWEYAMAHTG